MGYPQKLLSDGEDVVFEMRPHWRALLIPIAVLMVLLIGLVILWNLIGDWLSGQGAVANVAQWVLLIAWLFVLAVFVVRPALYWITTQFVFTNRRIIVRSGLVSRTGRDMPLSKVNNVSFDITVVGRLLNYGKLTIDSASDEALIIHDVPNVEHIQREVNRLHEEDDMRRRRSLDRQGDWPDADR